MGALGRYTRRRLEIALTIPPSRSRKGVSPLGRGDIVGNRTRGTISRSPGQRGRSSPPSGARFPRPSRRDRPRTGGRRARARRPARAGPACRRRGLPARPRGLRDDPRLRRPPLQARRPSRAARGFVGAAGPAAGRHGHLSRPGRPGDCGRRQRRRRPPPLHHPRARGRGAPDGARDGLDHSGRLEERRATACGGSRPLGLDPNCEPRRPVDRRRQVDELRRHHGAERKHGGAAPTTPSSSPPGASSSKGPSRTSGGDGAASSSRPSSTSGSWQA